MENNKYIHTVEIHNTRAAEEIVPVLMEWFHPNSVVDVGCGLGTWLNVFKLNGAKEILGIDGNHLDTTLLAINRNEVLLTDLEEEFGISRKFDLAISLEVAEHISSASADRFIESLTKLSDIIIFSAAIPNQGGQNHLNEQWIGYWESKFAEHDYVFTDEIRPLFWNNENVDWWYKQNMVIAIKKGIPVPFMNVKPPFNLVHPGLLELKNWIMNNMSETINTNYSYIGDLEKEKEWLKSENSRLKIRSAEVESELKKIYDSMTWKLANRLVIAPVNKIRKFLDALKTG
ncbi:MAG: methyltransferase domain-containing protein [Bacteroidetes bacterium]|nr:methyltransferase domain-containing protein [Bacteroidota bacterium]